MPRTINRSATGTQTSYAGYNAEKEYSSKHSSRPAKSIQQKKKNSQNYQTFNRIIKKLHLQGFVIAVLKGVKHLLNVATEDTNIDYRFNKIHLQHTNYLYRTAYITKYVFKIIGLIFYGILKIIMPVIIPAAGVLILIFSFWVFGNYSIAINVMLDSEHIAYVKNQQAFDDIRAAVENRIMSQDNGEYVTETIPTMRIELIKKDEFTDSKVLETTLYNSYQEYIGQSYGVFIDGEIAGTTRNAEDFERLLSELVQPYLTGDKSETYTILNNIEIVRDTYPKSYEKSYDEFYELFTTSRAPTTVTVQRGDTAAEIAADYGISVPVLQLLNMNVDTEAIKSGDTLTVGKPMFELKVQTVRYINYSEIIPYETKYVYTDSMYEGNSSTKISGSNGIYDVTAEVREVNGIETYREIVTKKKVKDPVSRQILVGTKTIAPSGTFIRPVKGGYISSGFGNRTLRGQANFHRGLDIAVDYGTPIKAADAGVVVKYGWDTNGLGNYVAIDHGNGIWSYYGHCSSLSKEIGIGSKVYQGQVVAYVGSTGNSTGNHVHFALYNVETGSFFDPLPYIKS